MSDIDTIINATCSVLQERYKNDSSMIPPTIYAYKDDELKDEFKMDFEDDQMKDIMAEMARHWLFEVIHADACCFVSEVWMASYSRDEMKDGTLPDIAPSENPNRIEAIVIQAQQAGRTVMQALEMIRDSEDNVIELRPHQRMDSDNSTQRLAGRWDLFDNDDGRSLKEIMNAEVD
jgi:hypothetical protein